MKLIQYKYFVIIVLGLILSACDKHPAVVGKITEYGIYKLESNEHQYEHSTSTAGYASVAKNVHVKETLAVPLNQGIRFGYTWVISGFSDDVVKPIVFKVSHPRTLKPDGTVTEGFEEPYTIKPSDGVYESTEVYILREPHELVEGEWTISVIYEGKVVVSKTFKVMRET